MRGVGSGQHSLAKSNFLGMSWQLRIGFLQPGSAQLADLVQERFSCTAGSREAIFHQLAIYMPVIPAERVFDDSR